LLNQSINLIKQKNCKVIWIPREKNIAGIDLERRLKEMSYDPTFRRNVRKFGVNNACYRIKRRYNE